MGKGLYNEDMPKNKTGTGGWASDTQPAPFNVPDYLPILNILVPQLGQTPCVAGLPFFMVMDLAFFISFFERHFTQYPCIIHLPF